ncbi:hypothetical protein P4S93_06710 [Aneurinibacillus thermoaerophilus]|uniref:hypothetical protein n=1 Tax=Aneurinibacillus thermoaerophilus TaxID=143495 RepID=UPI002E23422E|nr:hypothetical protein [Aneurinibacillus thermoaerophilus]MED0760465.1 hypothetical protein [Aneurinibacillus thermoaerophilus]
MKKSKANTEFPEDVSHADLQQIIANLNKFEVKFPDQNEINSTIETARTQMRIRARKKSGLLCRFSRIIWFAFSEISVIRPIYWLTSIALYVAGALFTWLSAMSNPYMMLLALSPTPFMLGLIEVFRGRDERMLELEMSCRYNAISVILSKLFVIGVYNIFINFVCSILFSLMSDSVQMYKITLFWLTPFTLVCGLSLMIAIRLRGGTSVMAMVSIWVSLCMVFLLSPALIDKLLVLDTFFYLMLIVIGTACTAIQIKKLLTTTNMYFERNVLLESHN